ncbi:peptidase M50B-like protein [Terracoccus luteus]|uniref:Peptidase M50B-like protein n=1 Tax=Terracoccus luteus TaxID=53356 RepID=A0A495Y3B2_9MICO|nr:M50 family metallopeptidase [Terracoccus luteus]RKT79706.1 peptidase M50B-like protein [Terracoccus luteus]
MSWADALVARLAPTASASSLTVPALLTVLALALVAVAVPPVWRVVRLAVTLVHELGHAGVGVLVGRRFTGFVLRGDMSGHAVTHGPARGVGRVASTWFGYPAPAVVGAVAVWLAGRGWAATVVSVVLVVLVLAVARVRSPLTLLVVLVAIAATGLLWWRRDDVVQQQVLVGTGVVLVVGAWRHLAAVLRDRSRSSDPGVLAALTHVPRVVWNASFVLVCAVSTAVVVREVALVLR